MRCCDEMPNGCRKGRDCPHRINVWKERIKPWILKTIKNYQKRQ